jgi:Protein kinase domain
MVSDSRIASMLIDSAMVQAMVPWPCPSDFGPDNRYRLEEMVSSQDRAVVYRAIDRKLSSQGFNADVAIKILPKGESISDEVLAARRIDHPNVLRVYDRGKTADDHQYLVAEFVEGETLQQAGQDLSLKQAVRLMIHVARGIHAAHLAGVYHCDLKPGNIVLASSGEPKVVDFGFARLEYKGEGLSRGNLAFMAPEQFRKEEGALTPPADIYALGGLLYFLVSGRTPNGNSREEIQKNFERSVRPASLKCDHTLDRICDRALSLRPNDRHESAAAFANDLEAWLEHRPVRWVDPGPLTLARLWIVRSPVRFVAIVVIILSLVGVGSYMRYGEIRIAQQKFEAESKALKEVTKEYELLKGDIKSDIVQASQILALVATDEPRTIVWLRQMFGHAPFLMPGGQPLPDEVVAAVRDSWKRIQTSERRSEIESLLAGFALSQSLLTRRDLEGARQVLDDIETEWGDRLAPSDRLAVSLDAMRRCIEVLEGVQSGQPAADLRLQFQRIEWELNGAGVQGPLLRLVQDLRIWLEDDAEPSESR